MIRKIFGTITPAEVVIAVALGIIIELFIVKVIL